MQPQENPARVLPGLHGNSTEGFLLNDLYCLEVSGKSGSACHMRRSANHSRHIAFILLRGRIPYLNPFIFLLTINENYLIALGRTPNIANHVYRHLKNIFNLKLFFFTTFIQLINMSGDLRV